MADQPDIEKHDENWPKTTTFEEAIVKGWFGIRPDIQPRKEHTIPGGPWAPRPPEPGREEER